jgi:hypothetical protein
MVQTAVHVENWDALREMLDWKVAGDDVLQVDEVSSHSAVYQSFHRNPTSSLDRLQVQWDVQGVSALNIVNDVLPGKSPFPLWAMNTLKQACPCSQLRDRGLRHCPHSQLGGSAGFHLQDGRGSLSHSDRDWDGECTSHYHFRIKCIGII